VSSFIRVAALGIYLGVSGCAIHPLPEDVTGVPTDKIVRKIRCEARTAIKDNLTQWLMSLNEYDPVAYKLGVEFDNGTRPLNTFRDSLFRGQVKTIIQTFENSAIAYDFAFDMTEINNLDATLDLLKPIRHATGTAALTAGIDRTRENIRSFTITDTFAKLLTNTQDSYCNMPTDEKNYVYPITGNIGIGEMIHTFVVLSLFSNLSAKSGPPTMADKITFTTTLSGSVTPKIVLTPIGNAVQVADASLVGTAKRTDAHTVTVALALPPPPTKNATPAPQAKVGLLVNASGTPAELTAAHTIEQFITRFELGKSGTVVVPGP
jgi:hypothetical protein